MNATLHRTAHKRAKTARAGAFAPVNTERFIVMMNREHIGLRKSSVVRSPMSFATP